MYRNFAGSVGSPLAWFWYSPPNCRGQAPTAAKTPHTDVHGDPLPAGAVAGWVPSGCGMATGCAV